VLPTFAATHLLFISITAATIPPHLNNSHLHLLILLHQIHLLLLRPTPASLSPATTAANDNRFHRRLHHQQPPPPSTTSSTTTATLSGQPLRRRQRQISDRTATTTALVSAAEVAPEDPSFIFKLPFRQPTTFDGGDKVNSGQ
jgi:hypothetical protein